MPLSVPLQEQADGGDVRRSLRALADGMEALAARLEGMRRVLETRIDAQGEASLF